MKKYTVIVDGDVFEIEVGLDGQAWVDQEPYEIDLRHVGGNGSTVGHGEYSLLMDHRSYEIHVGGSDNGHHWVSVGGRPFRTRLHRGHGARIDRGMSAGDEAAEGAERPTPHVEMRAPLPGRVVELCVLVGERVEEQQVVAVLESMKMNLELRAPREGVVRDVRTAPEQQVAQDEVLVILGQ